MAKAGWHSARDKAFTKAVAAGETHFNGCGNCHDYVCNQCFDNAKGLCVNRGPDVKVKITQACAQGDVSAASREASGEGQRRGTRMAVTQNMQLVCTQWRA
jgi:hypothetical protein